MGRLTVAAVSAVVVSCEHAAHRLPPVYRRLGLSAAVLRSHRGWDPGAAQVARLAARRLAAALHLGRWSRLLIDLNRSPHHRDLVPRRAFGLAVPGNAALPAAERRRRMRLYYLPYRAAVLADVERAIRRHGACLHLSLHSFTPRRGSRLRNADVGLLYDPARRVERTFVRLAAARLRAAGLKVRLNYPYRGTADGFTTFCRRSHPDQTYAGVEVEMNQHLLRRGNAAAAVARCLDDAAGAWLRRG